MKINNKISTRDLKDITMIEVNLYKNKKVGIFGLGITGLSVYKSIKSSGARIVVWDDNQYTRNNFIHKMNYQYNLQVIQEDLQSLDNPKWNEIDVLIVSPGIANKGPKTHRVIKIANSLGIKIISDLELLYLTMPFTNIIAITGTNGKSTTTSLIGHILKESNISCDVGGNIGNAALSMTRLKAGGYYVLECSSFQLELIDQFRPKISIILNITPDHLDRYANMNEYISAKTNIFKNQTQHDTIIIGIDNDNTKLIYEILQSGKKFKNIIPFSVNKKLSEGAFIENGKIHYNYGTNKFSIDMPKNKYLNGNHNLENIIASVVATFHSGVDPKSLNQQIETFVGLNHRMEYLQTVNGVDFINDSKATNVESAIKALEAYNNILWIAGGYKKGDSNLDTLDPVLKNVKKAFLIGDAMEELANKFDGAINFEKSRNLENAFNSALKQAKKGDVVLLSPAYASFDQFKNYVERGNTFKKLVLSYANTLKSL